MNDKIIYSKYNNSRNPEYNICTSMIASGNVKYINKRSVTEKSINHIKNIQKINDFFVKNVDKKIAEACAIIKAGEDYINYEYVKGLSFFKDLELCFIQKNKEKIFSLLDYYYNILLPAIVGVTNKFVLKNYDEYIFNGIDDDKRLSFKKYCKYSYVDAVFSNLIKDINKDKYIFIDNEWFIESSLPFDYIFYRSVYLGFYRVMECSGYDVNLLIPIHDVWCRYNINIDDLVFFDIIENNFQKKITGINGNILNSFRQNKEITLYEIEKENQILNKEMSRFPHRLVSKLVTFAKTIKRKMLT